MRHPGESPDTNAVVRDSAGITIVENTTPAWGERGEWRLGEVPDVTIGDQEGASAQQLFRVSRAVAMPDGRIAVANGGTLEIRFFDSQGRFIATSGERYQIAVYTVDGRLERLIRWDRPTRPVTPEDVENLKRLRLANARDDNTRRRIGLELADLPIPPTMAAHGDLRTDAEENLWVEEYRAPGEYDTRWIVFDPEGRLLGPVQGPARFTAHEIGVDFVLGVRVDELDVERVERYRLIKFR